jgi:hypothetical protein
MMMAMTVVVVAVVVLMVWRVKVVMMNASKVMMYLWRINTSIYLVKRRLRLRTLFF